MLASSRRATPRPITDAERATWTALAATHTLRGIAAETGRGYNTIKGALLRWGVRPVPDKPGRRDPVGATGKKNLPVQEATLTDDTRLKGSNVQKMHIAFAAVTRAELREPVPDLKRCPNCAGPVLGADWQDYHVCIERPEPMGVQLAHNAMPPETTPMQRSDANYRNLSRGESRPWPLSSRGKRMGGSP